MDFTEYQFMSSHSQSQDAGGRCDICKGRRILVSICQALRDLLAPKGQENLPSPFSNFNEKAFLVGGHVKVFFCKI